jgi:stage II sporulation protein D
MKKLILIIIFLVPIYISSFKVKETTFFNNNTSKLYGKTNNNSKTVIVHVKDKDLYLDLEDYVSGVVAAEMPVLFDEEALKAQAVASRSYAMSSVKNHIITISSSSNDQVYKTNYELLDNWLSNYDKYFKKIQEAVRKTENLVIKRDNKILKTYYFSMSNGYTENSLTVFNENTFESVSSSLEQKLSNYKKTVTFTKDELCKLLKLDDINIQNIKRNETNHVDKIIISNKEFTGVEFRKLLTLRSTDFEIEEDDDKYIFTTKGYGHGVGMSQYGANEMAKAGKKYDEILKYYYKNTEIKKI